MTNALRPYAVPALLLGVMFGLMLSSSWSDSAIIDELAHVPAGYSYLFLRDYRLNPEHPPLAKLIAALPLAFTNVKFPIDVKSWAEDVNGQWDQGRIFLYEAGNDPDAILRLMRLPLMLLAVLLGWVIWSWTRGRFGVGTANLALFFYALSPTVIAHARFVTTDLAASFGFFIGIVAFIRFLESPTAGRALLAGLAFGTAQLLKFSLVLLVPIYALMLLAWVASRVDRSWPARLRLLAALSAKAVIIAVVAVALIWLVYAYAVWNYPPERQLRDAEFILTSFASRQAAEFDLALIQSDALRPLGQYLLGLFMVLQRAAGGNTQYFLGDVSAAGDTRYFPLLYLAKEPLALHVLTLTALWLAGRRVIASAQKRPASILAWINRRFPECSALAFIAVYWASSLSSTLNIGVRHVLPTFPFIYILVSKEIVAWLRFWPAVEAKSWRERLRSAWRIHVAPVPRQLFVGAMAAWLAASVLATHPYELSYYNELAGGTDRGYRIGVDSNYDWGQDLKRLAAFAEKNNVQNIALDYFGGGSPGYYLGGIFEPWWSAKGYPPRGGWFAISATFQMGAYGTPVKGFTRRPEDSYEWLKPFRPVARAGTSIFIYQLPPEPPPGLAE